MKSILAIGALAILVNGLVIALFNLASQPRFINQCNLSILDGHWKGEVSKSNLHVEGNNETIRGYFVAAPDRTYKIYGKVGFQRSVDLALVNFKDETVGSLIFEPSPLCSSSSVKYVMNQGREAGRVRQEFYLL